MEELSVSELKEELRKRALSVKGSKSILIKRLREAASEDQSQPEKVERENKSLEDTLGPNDSVSQVTHCSSVSMNSKTSITSVSSAKSNKGKPSVIVKALMIKLQDGLTKLEKILEDYEQEPTGGSGISKQSKMVKPPKLNVHADTFHPSLPLGYEGIIAQAVGATKAVTNPNTGHHPIEPISQEGCNSSPYASAVDARLMENLISFNLKGLMPKSVVPTFSGDATEYSTFIDAFEGVISDRLTDDREKLRYLVQYTSGRARDIVKACLHLPPELGYKEARSELHEKYGKEEVIVNTHINKIMNWPKVKEGDVDGLEEFAIQLSSCRNMLKGGMRGSKEIELPETLRKVLSKLPFSLQERWRSKAYDIRVEKSRTAEFEEVVAFVVKQARILADPFFGRHVMDTSDKAKENRTHKKEDNYARQEKTKPRARVNAIVGEEEQPRLKCFLCKGQHCLEECEELRKKPDKERMDYVMQNSLCFGCLRRGHSSKECKSRRFCKICQGRHPTALHRDPTVRPGNEQAEKKGTVKQSSSGEQGDTSNQGKPVSVNIGKVMNTKELSDKLSIIPVKIRDSNGDLIPTYAFLDSGSTATFCTRDLLGRLTHQNVKPAQLCISTMHAENVIMDTQMITGIEICDLNENNFVSLPPCYTLDKIPVSREDIVKKDDLENWAHLHSVDLPDLDVDIGLLIGRNAHQAIEPLEVISSPIEGGPYAVRTRLGWIVFGSVKKSAVPYVKVNRVKVEDVTLDNILVNIYNQEFMDVNSAKRGLSEDDRRWIAKVEESCRLTNTGHYEIGMPFRDKVPTLPNNKKSVAKRLDGLKKRFMKDDRFHKDYCEFMSDIIKRGYAEEVPETTIQDQDVWYIPHHGVYHQQKTEQLRVVFDCAAKYQCTSLNDALLQGPDLANPLVEVLLRFRQYPFAYMADIKSMFYQVLVPKQDRDYLRFLWWPNGNFHGEPIEYRMTVHPFGAKSSPSCANYALRKTVKDHSRDYSSEVQHTLLHNFYVDDCLKSAETEGELVKIAHEVKDMCSKGGFELTKFVSNSRELLSSLPVEDRGKKVKELDLCHDSLPTERALGIIWNIKADTLTVSAKDKNKPLTKKGILSTIGAMYDPLGIVAPILLQGRLIMQDLCRLNMSWDEAIPETHQVAWMNWKQSISELSRVSLDRCVKPKDFGSIISSQVHHFSDASEKGYGTCTYLRLCNRKGRIHCAFLFGKAHVAPLKAVTIPRLELMAAVSAVRVNNIIARALEIPVQRTVFWTDSTTVLRYVRNDSARFHTFVANRLSVIRDGSQPRQWRYVNSELNPADDASRGTQSERWLRGPEFLYADEREWPEEPLVMREEGLEIKSFVGASNYKPMDEPLKRLMQHYSSWHRLKKAVAWILRVRATLLRQARKAEKLNFPKTITVKELDEAESAIIQVIQRQSFSEEIVALSKGEKVKKGSSIRKLNPVLHDGMLRVGGRLSEISLSFDVKYPVILPGKHHATELIIRNCHEKAGHQGREHVLSSLREKYWIVKGNTAVRKVVGKCVKCRKYQAPVMQQLMANLPGDTVFPSEPPFTCTGVDCFGPFYTKRGRSEVKRYGVIFTCLTIHAVHIEVAESLSTDSFINALRRFIARRGQVKSLRCDRGTNFVGAERELREAINGWNQASISETLLMKGIDWVFNPPHASHYGGIWERQIRTVRKVLNAIMKEQVLNDESLNTLMCEVEAVINSWPLTNNSSDHQDPEPLTPNHLLIMRNGPLVVGLTNKRDMYCKRRWRHVQYLADLFWKRWKYEYLLTLQERQKWHVECRNLKVGDVVLLAEENSPRCQWPLGRVSAVKIGRDGLVRSATVKCKKSAVDRPLSKLVLLCKGDSE